MGIVGLVPMKGNSERIPNKNLKEFNGRPLCHWILNTLSLVEEIDSVYVNTDSDEIKEEVGKLGVNIIDRPNDLIGDSVSMNNIIAYDLDQIQADMFLQTHCTNPLLRPATISTAIQKFMDSNHSSLFSVTKIQNRLWDEDISPINHERGRLIKTQDLPPVYEENSNIYIFNREEFRENNNRIGKNPQILSMQETEAIDIDRLPQFKMAEKLHIDEYGRNPDLNEVY